MRQPVPGSRQREPLPGMRRRPAETMRQPLRSQDGVALIVSLSQQGSRPRAGRSRLSHCLSRGVPAAAAAGRKIAVVSLSHCLSRGVPAAGRKIAVVSLSQLGGSRLLAGRSRLSHCLIVSAGGSRLRAGRSSRRRRGPGIEISKLPHR